MGYQPVDGNAANGQAKPWVARWQFINDIKTRGLMWLCCMALTCTHNQPACSG
jgi:hypothetical protein